MITTNICYRVFRLRYRSQYGTCFTVDVDGKQYLITAKHLLEGLSISDRVGIYYRDQWADLDVVLLGFADGEIDIAVLRPSIQLSPNYPLEPTIEGLFWGQDAYFLGFSYGLTAEIGEANRDFPLPFVKKCVVSLLASTQSSEKIIYLDGYNNPGFSGGPVIFNNPAMSVSDSNPYKVAAVITGFQSLDEPIYDATQKTHLTYRYNTGIIVAYQIDHALDIIRSNPDGFVIVENELN